jgi:5-methylcytosine-specific restriction enzyme subunit McrC
MSQTNHQIIELQEYSPKFLSRNQLTEGIAEQIWNHYRNQVVIDFPSPKTDWQWRLTAQGWIGYIPLSGELGLSLLPKVPLQNLFKMLEYAYSLKSIKFLDGIFDCQSFNEFYEYLADILARQILNRSRKGFYKSYIQTSEKLPYIRGRLNLQDFIRSPWSVNPQCVYEEHTADIDENKLIAWTLLIIARSGMCSEQVLPNIRKAFHCLQTVVSIEPFQSQHCINRQYHRLNEDYQPMHLLCRFFLDNTGPTYNIGDQSMIPFMLNVANLFELFVAEWLKTHLPSGIKTKKQEQVAIGTSEDLYFKIDIVLSDEKTNSAFFVLDTKYKGDEQPQPQDIAQVVAYASAKHCKEAVLIYPRHLSNPLNEYVGDIRVRSIGFALQENLDESGKIFLETLFNKA